ncbi:hypothetical protein EDC04DRAFT_2874303 [Pisolithus marmoratus]|nr:hypothetical protein EDC04DRAFT_2874303 [Pisolithus marmoratus]
MEAVETANEQSKWAPFQNEGKWELACFLMKNVGQTKMDEFLKLDIVQKSGISFDNAHSFLKYVDRLCTGPGWMCEMIDVEGDIMAEDGTLRHEHLELWWHDPIECIQELMGNLAFWDVMSYMPEHAYTDANGENHIYDEMWMGNWWQDVQTKLPDGAVVAPVILSSDKTTLSQFSGDKKAWLVYLTIGNISKDVRQQVSAHATMLIGYLPVSKLKCFQKKSQSLAGYHLFHHAISLLLCPLADAVHPILAAYITDFPEQCLVACNKESQCPHCLVQSNKHGDLEECVSCSMADTYKTLQHMRKNKQSRKFDTEDLHAVFDPFWKELPFMDIFTCLTPNILHQLHKGVFHDHLVQWCISIVGEKEVDACFQAMTQYPALCHFKKGISSVSQWTGTEHKEMQRVFISLLASAVEDHILVVVHSLLDFIYYAQVQQHMDTTLAAMEESLKTFHDHKHVLVELEIHSMQHYISSIRALGSADGYNTKRPCTIRVPTWPGGTLMLTLLRMDLWMVTVTLRCHVCVFSASETIVVINTAPCLAVKAHYKVAKTPPQCQLPVDHIECDYGAFEFIPMLKCFLALSDRFNVYNHMYVETGPSIITGHSQSFQKIRALPYVAARGHKKETPARFDIVFILDEGHPHTDTIILNSACILISCHGDMIALTILSQGMKPAQVHIVFKLPEHLRTYPHLLVYVEWFTTLQHQDPVSSLYIVSHSTQNHRCNASARCRKEISKDWALADVLEKASSFYINSYIDLDTFLALE